MTYNEFALDYRIISNIRRSSSREKQPRRESDHAPLLASKGSNTSVRVTIPVSISKGQMRILFATLLELKKGKLNVASIASIVTNSQ
jgi:hypothetical protein